VVETSQASWAETDLKDLFAQHEPKFEENKGDKQGPVTLISAVSAASTAATAPAKRATTRRSRNANRRRGRFRFRGERLPRHRRRSDLFIERRGWLSSRKT